MSTPRAFLDQLAQIRRDVRNLEAEYRRCRLELAQMTEMVLWLQNELATAEEELVQLKKSFEKRQA